jgi:hypothetical protein
MCDIDKDEEPTYEVEPFGTARPLADAHYALQALDDYLDGLAHLLDRDDLDDTTRTQAANLQNEIRAEVIALCDALKLIIVNPEDIPALLSHAKAANALHDLAEQAMILIEEHNNPEAYAHVSPQE